MKPLIRLIMLIAGVFSLLGIFIVPLFRLDPPEHVRVGWMLLNPEGDFATIPLISFVAGIHQPLVDLNGSVLLAAVLLVVFSLVNGAWLVWRAVGIRRRQAPEISKQM